MFRMFSVCLCVVMVSCAPANAPSETDAGALRSSSDASTPPTHHVHVTPTPVPTTTDAGVAEQTDAGVADAGSADAGIDAGEISEPDAGPKEPTRAELCELAKKGCNSDASCSAGEHCVFVEYCIPTVCQCQAQDGLFCTAVCQSGYCAP